MFHFKLRVIIKGLQDKMVLSKGSKNSSLDNCSFYTRHSYMYLHQHSHHLLYYHFLHHHHHHPLHHHGESLQFPDPQSLQTVHLQNHNIYSDVNLFTIKVYDLFIDLNCFSAYKSFHRFELFQNINFIGFPLNK